MMLSFNIIKVFGSDKYRNKDVLNGIRLNSFNMSSVILFLSFSIFSLILTISSYFEVACKSDTISAVNGEGIQVKL